MGIEEPNPENAEYGITEVVIVIEEAAKDAGVISDQAMEVSHTPEKQINFVPSVHEVACLEALQEERGSLHDREGEQCQMPVERFEPREEEVKHRNAPIVSIQLNIEVPKAVSENPSRRETLSPRNRTLSLSGASIAELNADPEMGALHE